MIFHLFIISSAVQIYEFSYIHYHEEQVLFCEFKTFQVKHYGDILVVQVNCNNNYNL